MVTNGPADVTQLRLGHVTGRTKTTRGRTTTTITRYALHSLGAARRPADGSTTAEVLCGTCGQRVRLTVAAIPVTMRTRRQWRMWGRILGIGGLAFIVLAFAAAAHGMSGLTGVFVIVGVLAACSWPGMASEARKHDGVKVAADETRQARQLHAVLRSNR
jgi:hypothetical protein